MTWSFVIWNIIIVIASAFVFCLYFPRGERWLAFQVAVYPMILLTVVGWLLFSAWVVGTSA